MKQGNQKDVEDAEHIDFEEYHYYMSHNLKDNQNTCITLLPFF